MKYRFRILFLRNKVLHTINKIKSEKYRKPKMDKAEAIVALIPNVRINLLPYDITNYKRNTSY